MMAYKGSGDCLHRSEIASTVNNLTDIPGRISEDEVVNWLQKRFLCAESYTWAGSALVAVNGCQDTPKLYTQQVKERYHDAVEQADPHVYAIAARSRHRIVNKTGVGKHHQAIVISGDSGSGKTFTAYHLLNFLTTFDHQDTNYDIAHIPPKGWRIWATMPVLTAFGNAQTECNHNSSRFGKLIQLQYGLDGEVNGAYIQTFMLEKTRVACQGRNQKNFHIFQQILAGLPDVQLNALHLNPNDEYRVVPGQRTDKEVRAFIETSAALLELGLSRENIHQMYTILAAIIHLGNITFDESEDAVLLNATDKECVFSFRACYQLLGLKELALTRLLTSNLIAPRSKERRHTTYYRPLLTVEGCEARRDCLMRFLYEMLFEWIVSYINQSVKLVDDKNCTNLGILDIYGFEVFQNNSLEQLCINYTNERLQSYFVHNYIDHTIKILRQELSEDFVTDSCIHYDTTLALLHSPNKSVFTILNEASQLGRHSPEQAVQIQERIYSCLHTNASLLSSLAGFTVRHYAGAVDYDLHKVVEKNMDKVPDEVKDSLIRSSNSFIARLMNCANDNKNKPIAKNSTVLDKYQRSLDNLLNVMDGSNIHYIRCVKASLDLKPGVVEVPFFKQQLISSGVMDLIPITCHQYRHFPHWFTLRDFQLRYQRLLLPRIAADFVTQLQEAKPVPQLGKESVDRSEFLQLVQDNEVMQDKIKVGRLSVFVSEAGIQQLEKWQRQSKARAVACIQRAWRKYQHQKQLKVQREEAEVLSLSMLRGAGDSVYCDIPGLPRKIHHGDGIISRMRLAEVPIRFHTRGTCLQSSHRLPQSELPRGLQDAIPADIDNDSIYLSLQNKSKIR